MSLIVPPLRRALPCHHQLPGFIRCNDQSEMLRFHGHWASYNRAFYRDVFAMSGALAQELDHGDTFSYERNPRALIFRRDQVHAGVAVPALRSR